jgi:hypothetical protein
MSMDLATNSLYIFMAGDNNLDISGVEDIDEMLKADLAPGIHVIAQFDRRKAMPWEDASACTTRRLKIENHRLLPLADIGETNTGDPAVLRDFLRWSTDAFPAQRKIAVVWNHGGGIKDTDIYRNVAGKVKSALFVPAAQRSIAPVPVRLDEAKARQLRELDAALNLPQRVVCTDDSSRDFLDSLELKSAFSIPAQRYDILAFDACMMSMFEVVHQMRASAEIVIGSEEIEPAKGWPYRPILEYLGSHATATNDEIARAIVELYAASYADTPESVTQSAVRTATIDATAACLDAFAGALAESLPTLRAILADIVISVQRFRDGDYADLFDFVLLCRKNVPHPGVAETAERLLACLEHDIVANAVIGEKVRNSHGLSIYFPLKAAPSEEVLETYRALDFTRTHPNWLRLITDFHARPGLQR